MLPRSWVIHLGINLIILSFYIIGALFDIVYTLPASNRVVKVQEGDSELNISGIRMSSTRVVLNYNKCDSDGPDIPNSALYAPQGMLYSEMMEDGSREASKSQFAHLSTEEEGAQLIGDVGLLWGRSVIARYLFIIAFAFQTIALVLCVAYRVNPVSLLSRCDRGGDEWSHFIGQVQNALCFMAVILLWGSIVVISTLIPVLLPHVFREARERCNIQFDETTWHHYEVREMGQFVSENSFPFGITTILMMACIFVSLSYCIYLFVASVKTSRSFNQTVIVPRSETRMLPWFGRIWPWRVSIFLLLLSVYVSFIVANATRVRGYPLNMFFWNYGTIDYEKTGLSKTGSLIDSIQEIVTLLSVSAAVAAVTTYQWTAWIPVLSFVCRYPISLLGKACQDICVLLFLRSLISWVTVAPTTVSMLEKPDCFHRPDVSEKSVGWLFAIDPAQSCNDTMFSVYVIIILVPITILVYFIRFSGLVNKFGSITGLSILVAAAISMGIIIVITRVQYSADIHIGACICVMYMLTQQKAYNVLFDRDRANITNAYSVLENRILPPMKDCAGIITNYNLVTKQMKGLHLDEVHIAELQSLYGTLGEVLSRAHATNTSRPNTEIANNDTLLGSTLEKHDN
jgi:hypothetical protein